MRVPDCGMPRRSLGALAALLVGMVPMAAGAAQPDRPVADTSVPTVLIEGRGFGHGVGMAQDGAYAMAAAGSSATDILAHFYPGTSIGRRSGTVQVGILDSPAPVVVALPGGGEIRAGGAVSPGFPVTVSPGGSVALAFTGGAYRATPVSGASLARVNPPPGVPPAAAIGPTATRPPTAPATPPTTAGLLSPLLNALAPSTVPAPASPATRSAPAAPSAPAPAPAGAMEAVSGQALSVVPRADSVVALPAEGRRYRGTVQAASGGGGLLLTNLIDVELYLRGMGEVPASWPAAALQAQAIAARTVAMEAVTAGRPLCDDQQCQVYVGAGNEDPATTAAAVATKGQVLTYGGALAEAVYSASGGGVSATAEEGFGPGSPDPPYLKPASYETADPQPWSVTVPRPQLAARFGYRGELTGARVSRTGPSGRPLEITLEGGNGDMAIDGHRFWRTLDLRSSLYTVRAQVPGPGAGAGAEPLDSLVSAVPAVGARTPGRVVLAVGAPSLGRAPWIGVAALLLACLVLGAHRTSAAPGRRVRPSPSGAVSGEPDEAPAPGKPLSCDRQGRPAP